MALLKISRYLRLRLGRVIPQRNALPLDFIETLLTEMIPVGKKAILGWTVPFTQHSPSQATKPPITAGQGGGREQRAGHQRRQGHSMMQIYGPHRMGFVFGLFFCFCFCNQSQMQTTTSMREGKKTKNKTNEEMRDCRITKQCKTRQHKAESQGKAQISIKYLKWDHK